MNDPTKKGGRPDSPGDPVSEAIRRAERAVIGTGKRDSQAAEKPSEDDPSVSFGEVDLSAGAEAGESLELDASAGDEPAVQNPAPAPRKPAIKKPALLQDEQWEDDGWASGQSPSQAAGPAADDEDPLPDLGARAGQPAKQPEMHKVRRAAPQGPVAAPAPGAVPGPAARPAPGAIPGPAAKPAPAAPAKPAAPEERAGPFVRVSMAERPRRNWGKLIKVALIVVLAASVIGGGVFGFIKWRQKVQADEQAQLDALNQGSLDKLKSDSIKKEQLGS